MSFMDRIKSIFAKRVTAPSPEDLQSGPSSWGFYQRADSGVFVTEENALGLSTVWSCTTLIARSVSMLPVRVMAPVSNDPADGETELANHPIENLLQREPNPETSAFAFKEALVMSALLHGNGFAEIERDQYRRPLNLWIIHPERVKPMRRASGAMFYEVSNGAGNKVELEVEDMLHIRGPSLDGVVGMGVIEYARGAIGLAISQEQYASSFIKNRAAPSGILNVKNNITPEGLKRLRSEIESAYGGPRQAGRTAVLDENAEWKAISLSPADSEFVQQRRLSVEDVARLFSVPVQLIGDNSKSTFANFEQASLTFLTTCLTPWINRLEEEVNRKLFKTVPGRMRPHIHLDTSALLRTNIEAQHRAYAIARQNGWMSVNDIRRKLGMEPIGDGGDEYLRPLNLTPVGNDAGSDPGNQQDNQTNDAPAQAIAFDRDGDGQITQMRLLQGQIEYPAPRPRLVSWRDIRGAR
jgi:HK97 family phage portal protein